MQRVALVDGDPAAGFAEWVRPHLPAMTRLAVRLAPANEHDDVVQDALVRAWRRRETFDPSRGSAQAWLLAVVADRARHARRRLRPASVLDADVAAADGGPPADPTLELAVRRLPRKQRLAVELHYYLGLPVRECASVLGVAEGTVKSALFDARARLRVLVEVRDE